jgi:hypothetical protein
MRRLSRSFGTLPWAAALLVAALYFLAVLIVIQFWGCLPPPKLSEGPVQTSLPGQRTKLQQGLYTVMLMSVCQTHDELNNLNFELGFGTGVILDDTHVLTAFHVVDCDTEPVISVLNVAGKMVWMTIDKVRMDADLARLVTTKGKTLALGFYPIASPRIGQRPLIGDTVCMAAALPDWERDCSKVSKKDKIPRIKHDELGHPAWSSDVMLEGRVRHGNSGAAVYDSAGNLVGIVTELDPTRKHGGRFTSLELQEDMLKP